MNNEKMREAFEAWWAESMNTIEMDLHQFGNGYSCHETNRCWMAWKASRAALCVELPKLEEPSGVIGIGFNVAKGMFIAKFMELGVRYK